MKPNFIVPPTMCFDALRVVFHVARLVQKGRVQSVQLHPPHVVRSEMSIALGLLNSFMSKKFPHGEEVYLILDGMGSEGMTECGRRDFCCGKDGKRPPSVFVPLTQRMAALRRYCH